jgi:hypothetical protein
MVAGSADVITFLGLGGLFVAHSTANLIIQAAPLVEGAPIGLAKIHSCQTESATHESSDSAARRRPIPASGQRP